MSSGPLAVRDDLFGFVNAFLTPRQGVDDNTNPKPPSAEPQNAAPGPQPNAVPDAVPQPSGVRAMPEGSVSPVASPGLQPGDDAVLTGSWAWRMMMAQQEQRRKQAEEARAWDTGMSGLAGLASGISGGSYAPGQAGFGNAPRAGSSRETGSDALSLEEIRQFGDDASKLKTQAANKANVEAFKKAHPEMNPADIDAAVAGGDYGQLRTLGLSLTDPQKRAEASSAQEKVAKEKEFRTIMSDPALAARVMAATGITDPVMLRAAFDSGKLDDVIANAAKGTSDYQDYIKAYPNQEIPYAEFVRRKQENASPTGGMSKEVGKKIADRTITQLDIADQAQKSLPGLATNYEELRTGKGYVGGILGRTDVQSVLSVVQGMNIPGLELQGLTDSKVIAQKTGASVLARAKQLGSNPTDTDRKYIEAFMGGDLSVSREALVAIAKVNMQSAVVEQLSANKMLRDMLPGITDPALRTIVERQIKAPADYTNVFFDPTDSAEFARRMSDPALSPQNKQAEIAAFEKRYGPEMGRYYLDMKGIRHD